MSALQTAKDAWLEDMPDWIEVLATACEESSQNAVSKMLGRSASLVSNVLRKRYSGDMDSVEQIVRGALMRETIECPVLGVIGKDICVHWRKRANSFLNTNTLSVTMYGACNHCLHFPKKEEG